MAIAYTDRNGVIAPCPTCGQKNRIAYERLGQSGHCGACRAEIGAPAAPVEVRDASHFDALVQGSPLPVLVDYWAPWCAPCRAVAPELEKVAAAWRGRLLVAKVNTEDLAALGERFGIRSIPTMAIFAGGRERKRTSGARPAADIEAFVRQSGGNT